MICQFGFKNFRSYKNETVFDFQAAALSEFKKSLIENESASSLLPVSVIYGPNGGGKSNIIYALSCLISTVVKPIYDLKKNRIQYISQTEVPVESFLFDDCSSGEPTEFNLYFRKNAYEYRYYLALSNSGIESESLFRKKLGGKRTATIFIREKNNIELGASIDKASINKDVNPKMPYLSFLSINYNISVITEVQEWFESCIISDYSNPNYETLIPLIDDKSFNSLLFHMLNDMDIEVTGFHYDKENKELFLTRKINESIYSLPFSNESAGTKKAFVVLPSIIIALKEGRLLIVDELDAKLHPKLLRYIIKLFTNPRINKNHAQLLFTSHDLSTMKNDVFRRDEIWFAALGKDLSSEIYSLYDIRKEDGNRVNNSAAYDKQYLEGRYGADPYLKSMLDWEDQI
ncbi:MAG: AAA family ATPase [Clostridia bacterium]|nr:AAA family ATPase [Clostridia bacterium]